MAPSKAENKKNPEDDSLEDKNEEQEDEESLEKEIEKIENEDESEDEKIDDIEDIEKSEKEPYSENEEKEEKIKTAENEKNKIYADEFEESAQMTAEKIRKWFDYQGWKGNPFVLNIIPSVFVGYDIQKNRLISCVEQKHKVCLVVGATGSGKTTALRWLAENFGKEKGYRTVFISKPPSSTDEFVEIFNRELFKVPWYLSIFRTLMPHIKNINSVSHALNSRFKKEHLLILCDEIHEADILVLQWLRVIADQVENLSLVISGLPVFEEIANGKLETFQKRISEKVSLTNLSREDTVELIDKRIGYVAKDSNPKNPFSSEAIDVIFKETGGFPREILRVCDKAVNEAIRKGVYEISPSLFLDVKTEERQQESAFDLKSMPRRQREIIEAIRDGKNTPGDIIGVISLDKYKSKSHAVRSINNILQRMMKDGMIGREKQGKTFIYNLSPRIRSIAVRA